MEIIILGQPISQKELAQIAEGGFGDMVKAVVDVEQGIMAIGGELHADMELLLTETKQSKRQNVWGINLYPEKTGDDLIEFNSMINLKPSLGNRTRGVEDAGIQTKIREVVSSFVHG